MNNLMSPSGMERTVREWMQNDVYYHSCNAVDEVVDEVVYMATYAVVNDAVYDAVYDAVWQVLPTQPLHPNVDKFVNEVEQNWGGTCTSI